MKNLLLDASYLISVYDPRDQKTHLLAQNSFASLCGQRSNRFLIAWPVVYETCATRMARRQDRVAMLVGDWKRLRAQGRLDFVDDSLFREPSWEEWADETNQKRPPYHELSLVDRVLRNIMLAPSFGKIDALFTFDPDDFRDVCRGRQIALEPS